MINYRVLRPVVFYSLIYGKFFQIWGRGGGGGGGGMNKKKISENNLLTGQFQRVFLLFFFYFQSLFFFNTVKLVIQNNSLYKYFIIFLQRTITFNSGTLKNTKTEPQKYIFFFNETNNI